MDSINSGQQATWYKKKYRLRHHQLRLAGYMELVKVRTGTNTGIIDSVNSGLKASWNLAQQIENYIRWLHRPL